MAALCLSPSTSTCASLCVLDRKSIAAIVQTCDGIRSEVLDEMAIPSYLHWNPFVRWIIRKRLRCMEQIVSQGQMERLLDFGCGLGLLGESLYRRARHLYLCDRELRLASTMVSKYGLQDMTLLPPEEIDTRIGDGELDVVVAADVLEHFPTRELVDSQCAVFARKLAPHGRLLLSGPTETAVYRLARRVAGFSGDYHHSNVFDLEVILAELGWQRRQIVELPAWLPIVLFRLTVWDRPQ
jgi:2-polyprenyl-3-methyl-5-hydroxy-6-metoxy-1,4-benzoquinol methylase